MIAVALAVATAWQARLAELGVAYAGTAPLSVAVDRGWPGGSRRLSGRGAALTARLSFEPAQDEAAARRRLGDLRARLLAPFDGDIGYPGMVTRRYEVPAALRPREVKTADGRPAWILPATDRLSYGAGSSDLAPRRALVSFLRCPRFVLQLELFWKESDFDEKAALKEESRYGCKP